MTYAGPLAMYEHYYDLIDTILTGIKGDLRYHNHDPVTRRHRRDLQFCGQQEYVAKEDKCRR